MMERSYYTKEEDVRIQAGNIYYPHGKKLTSYFERKPQTVNSIDRSPW